MHACRWRRSLRRNSRQGVVRSKEIQGRLPSGLFGQKSKAAVVLHIKSARTGSALRLSGWCRRAPARSETMLNRPRCDVRWALHRHVSRSACPNPDNRPMPHLQREEEDDGRDPQRSRNILLQPSVDPLPMDSAIHVATRPVCAIAIGNGRPPSHPSSGSTSPDWQPGCQRPIPS